MAKVKPLIQDPALRKLLENIQNANKPEYEYDPAKQVEGYKTRFEASGLDAEKVTDSRNFVERALNLREDQNPLFDFFEVIGRPQQALFAGVKAAQTGEDVKTAVREGISGDQYVRFKEILHEMGMDDSEKLGVDDIAGFVGDVFFDPMNFALLPATGGVSLIAKQQKALDKSMDMLKGLEAAKQLGKKSKVKDVDQMIKAATSAVEHHTHLLKDAERVRLISPLRYGMRAIKEGGKGAFRGLDLAVDNILQKFDVRKLTKTLETSKKLGKNVVAEEKVLQQVTEAVASKELKQMDAALKHLKGTGLYRDIKRTIRETFNGLASIPEGVLSKGKAVNSKRNTIIRTNEVLIDDWLKGTIEHNAKVLGFDPKEFSQMVADVIEYGDLNYTVSVAEYLANPEMAQRVGMDAERVEDLRKIIEKVDPKMLDEYPNLVVDVSNAPGVFVDDVVQKQYDDLIEQREAIRNAFDSVEGNIGQLEADLSVINDQIDALVGTRTGIVKGAEGQAMFYRYVMEDGQEIYYINHRLADTLHNKFDVYRNADEGKVLVEGTKRDLTSAEIKQKDTLEKAIKKEEDLLRKPFIGKAAADRKAFAKVNKDITVLKKKVKDYKAKVASTTGDAQKHWKDELKKLREQARVLSAERKKLLAADEVLRKDAQNRIDFLRKSAKGIDDGAVDVPDYTAKGLLDDLDQRKNMQRYYSDETRARFEELGGFTRDADSGMIMRKAFDELTPEQQIFRRSMDETQLLINKMLKQFDELGSDLVNTIDPNAALGAGYLPHVATPERLNLDVRQKESLKNWVNTKELKGNTRAMGARNWRMSRYEAEKMSSYSIDNLISQGILKGEAAKFWTDAKNVKLFEDDLTKTLLNWSTLTTDSVASTARTMNALDELLVASAVTNDLLRPVTKGESIPFGMVEVEKASLVKKLESMERYVKDKSAVKSLISRVKEKEGDMFAINRNIFEYIGIVQNRKGTTQLMTGIKKLTDWFKRNKLLSPGFQLRNITGNVSRAYTAGMPVDDIFKNMKRSDDILKKGQALFVRKVRGEVLNPDERAMLTIYEEFMDLGFNELGRTLHDLPEHLWQTSKSHGFLDKIAKVNGDLNWEMDKRFRMGLYLYGKENPDFLLRYGTTDAAQVVRYAMFDYADLSYIEKEYMRNIIPFYTFTKKNLAYQAKNVFANPEKYNKLISGFDNMWSNVTEDIDDVDTYRRENFWIPIPIKDKDGNYHTIKSNLPEGDFGNFLANPLKSVVSATAPYIRAPFEIAANKQFFSDRPIQEFEGQKGYQIPWLNRAQEYAAGQLGLDVPIKTLVSDPIMGVKAALEGDESKPQPITMGLLGWGTALANEERTRTRKAYDKLDDIRNLMKYYKQEGVDIVTLAEAENKLRTNSIQSAIDKLKQLQRR